MSAIWSALTEPALTSIHSANHELSWEDAILEPAYEPYLSRDSWDQYKDDLCATVLDRLGPLAEDFRDYVCDQLWMTDMELEQNPISEDEELGSIDASALETLLHP